jgi:L-iditol 2-dehydrogenase
LGGKDGHLAFFKIKATRHGFSPRVISGEMNGLRKLVWRGKDVFAIEEISAPPAPRPDEVLLRVRSVGICGTDIHILKGAFPTSRPPMVLGHEISGEIAAVGREVKRVKEGDRVTVDAVVGCGTCPLCVRDRIQFCGEGFEFGITRDGGCQDYLLVPNRNVYPIPDALSFEEAAVLDMEVYNAVRKCGIEDHDSVLILGAGPIGLIACQVARVLSAGHITLSDPLEGRLKTAEALGVADAYEALASTKQFDVVIDCAGTSGSLKQALQQVRPCGRVLLYGVYEDPVDQLDLNLIVLKDLIVYGSQSDRTGWEEVIELVSSGRLDLKSLITHRFSLEEGYRAYDLVQRRELNTIKAVFMV